jgi:hypothetical protein
MGIMEYPPQQGPPQAAPQAPPEQEDDPEGQASELLRSALEEVRQAAVLLGGEQTTLQAEKITTLIQQILAGFEKDEQDLMAGKMNPQAMMRALG